MVAWAFRWRNWSVTSVKIGDRHPSSPQVHWNVPVAQLVELLWKYTLSKCSLNCGGLIELLQFLPVKQEVTGPSPVRYTNGSMVEWLQYHPVTVWGTGSNPVIPASLLIYVAVVYSGRGLYPFKVETRVQIPSAIPVGLVVTAMKTAVFLLNCKVWNS